MEPHDNTSPKAREHARELWESGLQQLIEGDVFSAVDSFNDSLKSSPTAEAYTYRGWAISFLGHWEEAIADCKRAISLDSDFGNPYNDIGVYLMQLGLLDQAIPWLEKAKRAKRYESKHYPHLNLGHIYIAQGEQGKALEEYVRALELDPSNEVARKAIAGMELKIE
jgi:Tfp pilus assembly protein PilF